MAAGTGIEWTEVTWNPTTGCDRISAGCDNCYALTLAKRLKAMGQAKYQNDGDPRTSGPGFGLTVHPGALRQPYTWPGHRVVFVNSMSDLFHARVPLDFVRQVFAVIADTPQHTYQVLTKRSARLPKIAAKLDWPPNLWMGVSIEHGRHAVPRGPPARRARGRPVPVLRAAAGAARRPGPGRDRLGNRRWRIRTGSPAARSCLGHRDPRCVRERGSAVLLQAVGRPDPEGGRPGAGRPEVGPDATVNRGSAQPDHALLRSACRPGLPTRLPCPAGPAPRAWRL